MRRDCCCARPRRGDERKEASLLLRWRRAGSHRRAQLVQREAGRGGDVLTAGGEDEDSGRPNWFSEDLECLSSQNTHTHKQNVPTSVMAGRRRGGRAEVQAALRSLRRATSQPASRGVNGLRWPRSCAAPLSKSGQIHQPQLHKPR